MSDVRVPSMAVVVSIQNQLIRWLCDYALPLWDRVGVDRAFGGYHENLTVRADLGLEASGDVRRGRVVARQLYVFSIGHRCGWRSQFSSPVDHGCTYLFASLHRGDGEFSTAVDAKTLVATAPFSLYEQAFYLFALAHMTESQAARHPIAATALACLHRLRSGWGRRAAGGFEESTPPSLPLKSNPHMHLLEAALAWIDVSEGELQRPWVELSEELVRLCLTRFVDVDTGVVREYFGYTWEPLPGDLGRLIEPGHQFEWAWLLLQWAARPHCGSQQRGVVIDVAMRLLQVGEAHGVDPARGICINEIWDDMSVKDADAKIWPQTERLKAWCAVLDRASSPAEAEHACQKIVAAAQGLSKYFLVEPRGLWHEVLSADGVFRPGSTKASSLYHVTCAIEVLRLSVGAYQNTMLY